VEGGEPPEAPVVDAAVVVQLFRRQGRPPPDTVRAAGGVVWRRGADGAVEVLVVHRPKYDDWSFPKGKLDPGETEEECALREVDEETGLRCELGEELPTTMYVDRKGRPKRVRLRFASASRGPPPTFVVRSPLVHLHADRSPSGTSTVAGRRAPNGDPPPKTTEEHPCDCSSDGPLG
jgi:8-oxo-dGTP pyrophosphatase MutT (NUDIX family)